MNDRDLGTRETGRTGEGEPGTKLDYGEVGTHSSMYQQALQKGGQMTDGYTDTQQRAHKPSDTPHSSPDVGPTQGRAHTQVRPRATRTPRTGMRAGPSAAGWEKVAALTRHVYLLICINERLYPSPPASRGRGRRICPWRGTLNGTSIGVPPALRGAEVGYKVRGSRGV